MPRKRPKGDDGMKNSPISPHSPNLFHRDRSWKPVARTPTTVTEAKVAESSFLSRHPPAGPLDGSGAGGTEPEGAGGAGSSDTTLSSSSSSSSSSNVASSAASSVASSSAW